MKTVIRLDIPIYEVHHMSHNTYRIYWIITGICSLILLGATIVLALRTRTISSVGVTGYITTSDQSPYLRSTPSSNSHILTILESGNQVSVIDSLDRNNSTWLEIQTDEYTGWIQAEYVSHEPP